MPGEPHECALNASSGASTDWPDTSPHTRAYNPGVEPRERLAIIEGLAAFTGSRLESFFRAHDLGSAYAKNAGSSKEQKINDALAAAERRGGSDPILAEAVRHFGLDGEPPRHPPKVSAADHSTTTPFEVRRVQRLHPIIQQTSGALLRDGHAGAAVFEAYKAVEVRVKAILGERRRSGRDLMAHAFKPPDPPISFNRAETQSDLDEQEGLQLIYMGAMQGIRNPKAHESFGPSRRSGFGSSTRANPTCVFAQ